MVEDIIVSVIMPVYNSEEFLKESVESILKQSFKKFELIIINDGSTDGSENIIREFSLQDNRIKFINRKNNKRIVYTLNEGIRASKGKYIARMDADDIARPDRFERQVEYLEKHPDIYVLGSAYTVFDQSWIKKTVAYNYSSVYMGFKFLTNSYLCHPAVMIRREAIEQVGYYEDTEAEDFDLFSRVSQKYKCANLQGSYILYREHTTNRSFSHYDKIKNSVYSTFEKNYSYYINDKGFCSKYYAFHTGMRGNIVDIPKYIYYSLTIQNKIRRNYNISVLNKEFTGSVILFTCEIFSRYFKRFKNLLTKS